jgi:hypothetical protein
MPVRVCASSLSGQICMPRGIASASQRDQFAPRDGRGVHMHACVRVLGVPCAWACARVSFLCTLRWLPVCERVTLIDWVKVHGRHAMASLSLPLPSHHTLRFAFFPLWLLRHPDGFLLALEYSHN